LGPKGMGIGSEEGYSEKLHSLNHSPNIFRLIKSGKLRWAGHLAQLKEGRRAFKI